MDVSDANTTLAPWSSGGPDAPTTPDYSQYERPLYVLAAVTFAYMFVCILGIVGNVLIIFVVFKNKDMRNSTNLLLLNLTFADLLVLVICAPTALSEFLTKDVWYFGDGMCKLIPFVENTVWHASALTILAISIERYCAICNPLQAPDWWTTRTLSRLLLSIWLTSSVLAIPFTIVAKTVQSLFYDHTIVTVCSTSMAETWQKVYTIVILIVFLLLPFILMCILYGRVSKRLLFDKCALDKNNDSASLAALKSRRQVVRMLVIVTVIFFVCSLPFRVISLMYVFDHKRMEMLGMSANLALITFARVMIFLNSALNPIVYNAISRRFRVAFKQILHYDCYNFCHCWYCGCVCDSCQDEIEEGPKACVRFQKNNVYMKPVNNGRPRGLNRI